MTAGVAKVASSRTLIAITVRARRRRLTSYVAIKILTLFSTIQPRESKITLPNDGCNSADTNIVTPPPDSVDKTASMPLNPCVDAG